jgi:hypothetical protein
MDWILLLVGLLPFLVLGAVTGKPRHGKNGRLSVGGVNMVLQNWQATDQVEDADCTNFEGGGFAEHLGGIQSCQFSASGVWNAAKNVYINPPNFSPGTFLTNLTAYVNVTDGSFYLFPSFFVQSVAVTVNVHQAVQLSLNGLSDGTYTPPDVNV